MMSGRGKTRVFSYGSLLAEHGIEVRAEHLQFERGALDRHIARVTRWYFGYVVFALTFAGAGIALVALGVRPSAVGWVPLLGGVLMLRSKRARIMGIVDALVLPRERSEGPSDEV